MGKNPIPHHFPLRFVSKVLSSAILRYQMIYLEMEAAGSTETLVNFLPDDAASHHRKHSHLKTQTEVSS
jgi:hypothetical protein